MTRRSHLITTRARGRALTAGLLAAAAAWATARAAGDPPPAAAAAGKTTAAAAAPCTFVGNTLVPRLAMGVRRVDGDDIDELDLRAEPAPTAAVVVQKPLFRPYYVADSRVAADGGEWFLLQEDYAAAPLGWAAARHVHLTDSRYAYTFATRPRERRADLHDDSRESYERLLAQARGNLEGGGDTVVVRERAGAEEWQPVRIDDVVPFVELRIPPAKRDREHPDTTPTFRHGIPVENRLVHMGAVCGGPVDLERLRALEATVVEDSGLEMLFVVDETVSMLPFNQVVAKFITAAGQLAVGRPVPVRITVCSYSDGPPNSRVTIGDSLTVKKPEDVKDLADRVAGLGNSLPPGDFANPPERMLEGLRDALEKVTFRRGATVFVAVVGDTGHEPEDPAKPRLIKDVADLVKQRGARVYFMHVGRRRTADEKLFREDFIRVQQAATALGVAADQLQYQPAERSDLEEALEKARDAVEDERLRLVRQIARMKSRTPYTEPGPKLLAALTARGLDRRKFEDRHLQYFVPSRGWLFHPTSLETAAARPQLRELFFLSRPEREAVRRLFDDLRDRLGGGRQIDGDAVVGAFGRDLAAAAGIPGLEGRVREAWQALPRNRRSVGVFLEDAFGLRLKAALPFPAIDYAKDRPATEQEITRMLERIARLGEAFKDSGDEAFWFEASSLVP